jgi:hypothetical protein
MGTCWQNEKPRKNGNPTSQKRTFQRLVQLALLFKLFKIQMVVFMAHVLLFNKATDHPKSPSVFAGRKAAAQHPSRTAHWQRRIHDFPGKPPAPGNETIRRTHLSCRGRRLRQSLSCWPPPKSLFHPFVTAGAGLMIISPRRFSFEQYRNHPLAPHAQNW